MATSAPSRRRQPVFSRRRTATSPRFFSRAPPSRAVERIGGPASRRPADDARARVGGRERGRRDAERRDVALRRIVVVGGQRRSLGNRGHPRGARGRRHPLRVDRHGPLRAQAERLGRRDGRAVPRSGSRRRRGDALRGPGDGDRGRDARRPASCRVARRRLRREHGLRLVARHGERHGIRGRRRRGRPAQEGRRLAGGERGPRGGRRRARRARLRVDALRGNGCARAVRGGHGSRGPDDSRRPRRHRRDGRALPVRAHDRKHRVPGRGVARDVHRRRREPLDVAHRAGAHTEVRAADALDFLRGLGLAIPPAPVTGSRDVRLRRHRRALRADADVFARRERQLRRLPRRPDRPRRRRGRRIRLRPPERRGRLALEPRVRAHPGARHGPDHALRPGLRPVRRRRGTTDQRRVSSPANGRSSTASSSRPE